MASSVAFSSWPIAQEILEQSLRTYREFLTVPATSGNSTWGVRDPNDGSHDFASAQSLTVLWLFPIPADAFDVVVIDEFHHAEAKPIHADPSIT